MARLDYQDDKLAFVDGVENPVIAHPNSQHTMSASDHLRAIRPRISPQRINRGADPAAHRLVEGQECLAGTRPPLNPVLHRLQAGLGPDLLPGN